MKKEIWKFQLTVDSTQAVFMPVGADILCIQLQDNTPCIWALVNVEAESNKRHFETYGTGHPISGAVDRKYIGTYQLANGLVFHTFERW